MERVLESVGNTFPCCYCVTIPISLLYRGVRVGVDGASEMLSNLRNPPPVYLINPLTGDLCKVINKNRTNNIWTLDIDCYSTQNNRYRDTVKQVDGSNSYITTLYQTEYTYNPISQLEFNTAFQEHIENTAPPTVPVYRTGVEINPFRNGIPDINLNENLENFYSFENAEPENEDCPICLQVLDKNVIKLRCCEHTFHKTCIFNYIRTNHYIVCPICRHPILNKNEESKCSTESCSTDKLSKLKKRLEAQRNAESGAPRNSSAPPNAETLGGRRKYKKSRNNRKAKRKSRRSN